MSNQERIVELFRAADVGFHFDRETAVRASHVEREFASLSAELTRRLGHPVDAPEEAMANAAKFAPLVQTFAMPMTTAIRAMVYCVLSGARITRLQYAYEIEKKSRLEVTVEFAPGAEQDFASEELWDAEAHRPHAEQHGTSAFRP